MTSGSPCIKKLQGMKGSHLEKYAGVEGCPQESKFSFRRRNYLFYVKTKVILQVQVKEDLKRQLSI